MATISIRPSSPDQVVDKVLRRAEVAKMARKLHDRLALASYKTLHGQEKLSFSDVEARLETALKRRRALSGRNASSTSCSTSSSSSSFDGSPHLLAGLASSPLDAMVLSDSLTGASRNQISLKHGLYQPNAQSADRLKRRKPRSNTMGPPPMDHDRFSWKSVHRLPQSSPTYSRHEAAHMASRRTDPRLSFASDISDAASTALSTNLTRAQNIRPSRHSQDVRTNFRSSPPRTPPPSRHRRARASEYSGGGEEGADLLLYLATSPSPAQINLKAHQLQPPSTPPSRAHNNISGTMTTPGLYGLTTPSQQFNFADFVNITPSPAQAFFNGRTPRGNKTPSASIENRRRSILEVLPNANIGASLSAHPAPRQIAEVVSGEETESQ